MTQPEHHHTRRTKAEWEEWAASVYQLAGDLTMPHERTEAEIDRMRELLLDNLADPWDMEAEEITTKHRLAVSR